jgi:hypothetical protein
MSGYLGHVIRDGERAVAVYRVNTVSYPLLTDDAKVELLNAWSRWAHKIEADFCLRRVTRRIDARAYAEQAQQLARPGARGRRWRESVDLQTKAVDALRSWRTECYVEVSLTGEHQVADGVDTVRWVRDAVARARGQRADVRERERAVRDLMRPLAARPAHPEEIQWLFRRAATRGIREPVVDQDHRGRADRNDDLARLRKRWADEPILEDPRTLVVGEKDDHVFQTVMVVGARPEEMTFPGCELMLNPAEALEFPADVALHVRSMSNQDALAWAGQKVRDADGAWSEATSARPEPPTWKLQEDRRLTRDLVAYLQHPSRPPLLWGSLSVAFAAETRRDLEKRRRAVQATHGAVRVEAPRYTQATLYWDHVPGTTGRHEDRFEEPMTTDEVGSLMPHGTHEAGERRGAYVGHTVGSIRRPVLVDLAAAPLESGLPGWLITGPYGSGKTLVAQLLLVQAALRGSFGVSIDPKGDHYATEWLAERGISTQIIEPTGDPDDQGLLDPLLVAPPAMRADRAVSYYLDLIPGRDGNETELVDAVHDVLASREPCGLAVIERLASGNEVARAVARDLEVQSRLGIGRLGFADRAAAVERRAQVTTIRPRGLSLPRTSLDAANWSRDERRGVATMKLLVAFAMRLLGDDRSQHKVFVLDELHVFRDNDGQQLIEQAAHYGRSYNASALFLAQLDTMVTDELARLVGYRAEMRRRGEGVLRDHEGRAARIQVDLVDPSLLAALNTAPDAARNRRDHRNGAAGDAVPAIR